MSWGWEQVQIRYGDAVAVHGATLEVPRSSITALVGGDGAGKTSLLRCLSGRIPAAAGIVKRPAANLTGVLTADPPGWDDLTVAENLAFVARVRSLAVDRAQRRIDALLAATELGAATHRLAGALSGGMRRKLGFAMATLHEPDLLLLDEPTTGVDPVSRTELWRLMADQARGGTAVVMATTYLDEAERCGRVLVLDQGEAVARGTPSDIVAGVQGQVWHAAVRGREDRSWRRGRGFRIWSSTTPVPDAELVDADLEDAVVLALLKRQDQRAAAVR